VVGARIDDNDNVDDDDDDDDAMMEKRVEVHRRVRWERAFMVVDFVGVGCRWSVEVDGRCGCGCGGR
jgi:hypothetical protein